MGSILSIDTMAQRYGMLPSMIIENATTFDLFICNTALRYQQVKQAEAEGDFSHYSEEDLLAIRNSV